MSIKYFLKRAYRLIPPRARLDFDFFRSNHYFLSLDAPQSFSEKIQVRKFGWVNPLFSQCSDKYFVKDYVSASIGDDFVIPTLFVSSEITADRLISLANKHKRVVVKTTHGSGSVYFMSSGDGVTKAEKIISGLKIDLAENFGRHTGESWYSNITPRIIVEPDISAAGKDLLDFKFHIFKSSFGSGYNCILQVDFERHTNHKRAFFDEQGRNLGITSGYPLKLVDFDAGLGVSRVEIDRMREVALRLAASFSYSRVDLYNVDGKILFGEMTFAHGSGFEKVRPTWRDFWIGSLWEFDPRE